MEKVEKVKKQLCAIYTRVSCDEQLTSDFTSLDSQRDYGESYIKSQKALGWELSTEKYDDPGYTGGNMDRPGLQKLLNDVRKGKFNIIVIYKIDRLTRSLRDFGKLWDMFEKYKVSFVSVTQKFDTTTSMGRLMLHILLSFAQFEREVNSERTRDKRMASAKRGKWLGGFPVLGYDVDHANKKLVVNKEEVKQVETIFKTYLKLKSTLETARELNQKGYRTKAWITIKGRHLGGKSFCKNTLKYYLKNTLFLGKTRYKDKLYDGEHPAIINEELFNEVKSCLCRNGKKKSSPYKNNRYDYLLTGLVRCTYCGSSMTSGTSHSKGKTYLYYRCTKVDKYDRTACKYRHVPARELENVVIERIKFLSNSPKILDSIIEKAHASTNAVLPDLINKLNAKTKRQSENEIDIENLKRCIKENLRKEQDINILMDDRKELIEKQEELAQEIQVLRFKIEELETRTINAEVIQNNFKSFRKVFNNLDYNRKRELLGLLIKEIRYNGEKSIIEIDLYQLPDIGQYINKAPLSCTLRTSRLPESLSNHKQFYSKKHLFKYLLDPPPYWITDRFAYGLVKAEKGFKMNAKWGFPALNNEALTLGSRIKVLRIKNGLNQAKLAESAGIGTTVLARYEQGNILDLNPQILQKIAKVLTIDPLELLPAPNHPNSREFLDYFCPSDSRGSRIRKLRLSRNLQQDELAKMAGVTKATVCRYEKDQLKPSNQVISRINEILES